MFPVLKTAMTSFDLYDNLTFLRTVVAIPAKLFPTSLVAQHLYPAKKKCYTPSYHWGGGGFKRKGQPLPPLWEIVGTKCIFIKLCIKVWERWDNVEEFSSV